jgi:hypothetical protein
VVLHHGGAGITAAATLAGTPQVYAFFLIKRTDCVVNIDVY